VEGWSHSYGIYIQGGINQSNATNQNDEANYNLIENNVLDWFSGGFISQYRPHYNVWAYNFIWNVWGDPGEYSTRTGFSIHHYDYENNSPPFDHDNPAAHKFVYYTLCEGNLLEGSSVGMNRHRSNAFFRNRVNNSGMSLIFDNFAFGNEFTVQKNPGTYYSRNHPTEIDRGSIEHGNYITKDGRGMEWDPAIDDHNIPDSFYLTSKPDFFGDLAWPPFGGDLMLAGSGTNANRSPSEVRYWSILFPEETPSGLGATVNGNDVKLTWTNNSTNEVDFIIVRSTDSGNCERIATATGTTYTDTVPADGKYYYYVRAVNHLGGRNHLGELRFSSLGGESDPSGEVMVIVE
jgi:hypothetical protein